MGIIDMLLGGGMGGVQNPDQNQYQQQIGLTDDEKKGLLYGSLISAGMAAATGGNAREAILNALSGGTAAYQGGITDTLKYKKMLLDQVREGQIIESAKLRDKAIQEHYGTEAEKGKMAIEAAKNKAASDARIAAVAPQIYQNIVGTPTPESQPNRLNRLGMIDPVTGRNLLSLTEPGSEGESMTRQFLGNNPAQMSTWGQENPTKAQLLLYETLLNPDKGSVVSNMIKTVFPDKPKAFHNARPGDTVLDETGTPIFTAEGKEPTERKLTPYMHPKGYTVLINEYDPASEGRIRAEGLKPISTANMGIRIEGYSKPVAGIPGVFFHPGSQQFMMATENGSVPLTQEQLQTMGIGYAGKMAGAKAPYTQRSMQIMTAAELFQKEAPSLISLRNKVQAKGFLPGGDTLKDINAINQWLAVKTNDPDVAELKKKTMIIADNLNKTLGGSQGGEWSYKVASDILDSSLAPEAFSRVFKSHGRTLADLGNEYKNINKLVQGEDITPYYDRPENKPKGMPPGMRKKSW